MFVTHKYQKCSSQIWHFNQKSWFPNFKMKLVYFEVCSLKGKKSTQILSNLSLTCLPVVFWFPSVLLEVFTGYIKNISNGIDDDVYKSRDSQPGEMSATAWGTQRSQSISTYLKNVWINWTNLKTKVKRSSFQFYLYSTKWQVSRRFILK